MGPPWKIQWVFFDAVGTLFRVRGSVGEVYGREASRHGFEGAGDRAGTARIDRAFKQAFRKVQAASPLAERRGETAQKEWWRQVVRETFRDLGPFPRFDGFFDSVFDLFATDAAWVIEPGCRRVLEGLKLQGRNLGIISNFDSRIDSVLKSLNIRQFFDLISVSSESPHAKPQEAMFRMVVRQAGAVPRRCLHVGDHPGEDYDAGRAAGLYVLLYDPKRRWVGRAEHRVEDFQDIESFLL